MKQLAAHLQTVLASQMALLDTLYVWDTDTTAKDFPDFTTNSTSHTQKNLALKAHVAEQWRGADEPTKRILAKAIIQGWGKLTNDADTLETYVMLADGDNRRIPLDGISSYSKLLAFTRPEQYAIYDSRVAVTLNALQLLHPHNVPVFFQYPAGRAKDIVRFSALFTADMMRSMQWEVLPKNTTYAQYMELLHGLAGKTHTIQHYEMLLFALAPQLTTEILYRMNKIIHQHWQNP